MVSRFGAVAKPSRGALFKYYKGTWCRHSSGLCFLCWSHFSPCQKKLSRLFQGPALSLLWGNKTAELWENKLTYVCTVIIFHGLGIKNSPSSWIMCVKHLFLSAQLWHTGGELMLFEDVRCLLGQGAGRQWSADTELKNAGFHFRCCVIARRRHGICALCRELCSWVSPWTLLF